MLSKLLTFVTFQPERSALKAVQPWNMEVALVTLLTSQPERSELNEVQAANISLANFTLLTFHLLRSPLKAVHPWNIPNVFNTLPTFQADRLPLNRGQPWNIALVLVTFPICHVERSALNFSQLANIHSVLVAWLTSHVVRFQTTSPSAFFSQSCLQPENILPRSPPIFRAVLALAPKSGSLVSGSATRFSQDSKALASPPSAHCTVPHDTIRTSLWASPYISPSSLILNPVNLSGPAFT